MTTPAHAELAADASVVLGERFLALERGPDHREGVWYQPDGQVEQRRKMSRRPLADLIDAAAFDAVGADPTARAEQPDVGCRLAST